MIKTNFGRRSRDLEYFFDHIDVCEIRLHLGLLVLLDGVITLLLVMQSTRQRVKYRGLELN